MSFSVIFSRDLRGRVVSVGTSVDPARFASYSYNADGSIAAETLGAGATARRFRRDPLRRLTGIDDPAFSTTLGYRVGGAVSGPYGDGRVTLEATSWNAAAFPATPPANTSRTYGFD